MKFGAVPVAEAEGGILAHSLRLSAGRLRKGARLTAEHIAQIKAAGLQEVVVAQLEAMDIHEDAAALSIASAAADGASDLSLSAPFTGRVNLIAQAPGVVCYDPERIIAANLIDPMITVATVPAFHQVRMGGMIATVKVISYAVAHAAVEAAAAHVRGAIRLAIPQYHRASLIVTNTLGGPGAKGQDAIEARLSGLNMQLLETLFCAHEDEALANTIRTAQGEIILILTGSATSDLRDTGPEALRCAGGQVTRFGIPVDPGNLLFLGDYKAKPVIGLPGSARSPVLHGADWVLSRVACGVPISDRDFATMGVGGLLKEIPTRPQPRRGPQSNR